MPEFCDTELSLIMTDCLVPLVNMSRDIVDVALPYLNPYHRMQQAPRFRHLRDKSLWALRRRG